MDFVIGGSLAAFSIYAAAKWQKSDKDKIQHTFRNVGYTVKDHEPKLFKTHKSDNSTLYTYHVPYGLIDDDELNVLDKVLNKPVNVSFVNGKLHIRVYKNKIPVRIKYDWNKTDDWTVPIGQSHDQFISHDFDKIPHMAISGMTRQGKTVLLKLIFSHLIHNHPDDAEFTIIDLKGGLEFNRFSNLEQVNAVASDVFEAKEALTSVLNQIRNDMYCFKSKGYTNVLNTNISNRKFIIVDEGAELTPGSHLSKEEKQDYQYCQNALSEIARVSGALGYRLIFATQYPTADTLPRQIKQNADAKISFRLPTETASRVAIDEKGAETLANVGRCIYRTHERREVQSLFVDDNDIKERLSVYDAPRAKENSETRKDYVQFG
ncbi:FtsK/SpoIIIE domain-containing protein [Lentibacillus amyloliquefaciens]|uniref:FtsK domain-containing protein n=1 Tax=Lentibacillus amyloliquefaciens TaxID=1472767 RepID=A0A0U4EBU3_9BACI|nr:FtsK/SpoIIIE domain-containing protein [Lentibacillus amyloliquefaciens]ALX47132.1 hypothetical protein AOX59_00050 [Lentibacillus amyloliquefaciens]ALX50481.1 hypothetical protein AOX59_18975 [Lentibacillus amyloliquefaciens]